MANPKWNEPQHSPPEELAETLEWSALLIEGAPGTNVLDAFATVTSHATIEVRDRMVGSAYYALLDYLPPHIEFLGPWSDSETSERVCGKLRQLAKTVQKGGPAKIEDTAALPITVAPAELDVVDLASGRRKKGRKKHTAGPSPVSKEAGLSEIGKMQHERGVLLGAITRAERARHPNVAKLQENRLRVIELERLIAEAEERERGDAEALALIEQSRAFPADRDPGRQEAAQANGSVPEAERPLIGAGAAGGRRSGL